MYHTGRRRNMLRTNTHFVWATKGRMPLIAPEHERSLHRYIESIFAAYQCGVLAVGGMTDHVHVLAAMSPKHSVSDVVKNVKGKSSRFYGESLASSEWFGWQPNYGATHVSPSHVDLVRQYVMGQKHHHADGTLLAEFEQTDEPADGDECLASSATD